MPPEEMIGEENLIGAPDEGETEEVEDGALEEGESEGIEPDENESEDEPSEEESEESEEEPVESKVDGRKMPDSLKKAISALKATDPKTAGAIKDLFYTGQAYREAFQTPQEAVAAKGMIEQVGGEEGIAQIESERAEWQQLDSMYGEGNPEFIKNIAETNPEAFVKMAPQAINEWAARAPEQYGAFAQQLAVNVMKSSGMVDKLVSAYHAAGDNPQLQSVIADAYNTLVDLHDRSQKFASQQSQVDPREQKLKEREQKINDEERAGFEKGIYEEAQKYLLDKALPEIERILSGRAEVTERHKQLVAGEVEKRLAAIPGFAAKLDAFYNSKDRAGSLSYIKSQYDKIVAAAVKAEIEPLYRKINQTKDTKHITGKTRPAADKEPGTVYLKEMPDFSQVDLTKCTTADVAAGHAVLKNGKKATGWV